MSRFDTYIICTTPRSGSTLLCQMLKATGCAGKPESYFPSPVLKDWMAYYDLDDSDFPDTDSTLCAIFNEVIRRGKAGTDIFGLRMQGKSRAFFLQRVHRLFRW